MCTQYKNDTMSFSEYIREFLSIYIDERAECYYYPLLKELLNDLCSRFEKVVRVDNNKKSNIHDRTKYAVKGGLQDLIIVPREYTYEKPTKPFVTIGGIVLVCCGIAHFACIGFKLSLFIKHGYTSL